MEPTLRVHVLGPLRVERDGEVLDPATWRRQRAADLLNTLALARDRSVSRDRLVAALWPTKDLKRGLNNLHRASHDLRAELGGSFVSSRGGVVRLEPEVWVDVEAFEAMADSPDRARDALALYRGRPRCDVEEPMELGLDARIESLHERFVEVSLRVGREAHTLGDPDGAVAVLRHLVEVDGGVFEGHRLLIKVLEHAGRRDEALRHLAATAEHAEVPRSWVDELREAVSEVAVAPRTRSKGRERIARMLLGTADPGPLRGREAEEREASAFVEQGRGVLVILGDTGQGKSRLVLSVVEQAMEAGARVMVGAALDVAGMPPYAPFVEAFHDRARSLGRPSPFVGASRTRAGDRLAVYRGVLDALEEDCADGPVLLVLEDLHHADESSLHLLRYLARAARTVPLSILATARRMGAEDSLDSTLMNLERERLGRRLTLHALDREATCALVRDRSDELDERAVERVAQLSGGNPLYAEELVHAFEDRGEVAIPEELGDAVRDRVAALGSEVATVLYTAAVLGTRFDLELAAAVARVDPDAALDAVDAAIAGQVIVEEGDQLRFRQALVRETLYEGLSGPRRRALHQRAARALEQETPARRPERDRLLAWHHQEAGARAEAVPYLIQAGRRAHHQSGLFEAAEFFQRALDILVELDGPPAERLDVMMRLGRARRGLSEIGRAVEQFDAAADLADRLGRPVHRAHALRLAALALITAGQLPPAEARLGTALEVLEGHDDPVQRADMLYHLAQLRWHQNRYDEAYELAVQCRGEASRTEHVRTRARAHEILALACHSLGKAAEGQAAEQAREALVGTGLDASGAFEVHL